MCDLPTQPRQPDTRPRRLGFTLLELILVLVVLAVMVAMAVPAMRGMAQGRGGDECSAQIMALANYGRAQAIAEGTSYRLNIDPTQGVYYLTKFYANDPNLTPGYYELGIEMGSIFRAPDGVTIEWDGSYMANQLQQQVSQTGQILPEKWPNDVPFVEFTPSGRTDPCLIRIVDRDGSVTEIVCPSATETIRVIRPDGKVKQ